jgi:hypothetical protein
MPTVDTWIGQRLGEGRFTLLGRIGSGSMGQVFRARDGHLGVDVVVKFPVAAEALLEGPGFLERFEREIRSLIRLSHPHVVKVLDAGRYGGKPYVVMQYLPGRSLKERSPVDAAGKPLPQPPESLHGWLADVAKALDFIHGQGFLHRDVKPANILFDAHGHAYLGDFGIIKALTSGVGPGPSDSALTAPGFLLGTPSYVAPEVVMGHPADGRVDQYSLAMTVHEVLSGVNVMAGPSPSATVVNQMTLEPPPLADMVPGLPARLSEAVRRALAKDPSKRFESCAAFAREVLADVPEPPVGPAAVPVVWPEEGDEAILAAGGPDDLEGPGPDSSAVTVVAADAGPSAVSPARPGRRLTVRAGAIAAGALGLALAVLVFVTGRGTRPGQHGGPGAAAPGPAEAPPVVVNIAYGTEKQAWLEQALDEFRRRPENRDVSVRLIGMGSVEAAQAVLEGEKPIPIHVWSPASSAYRDVFEREWRVRHGGKGRPIARAENLALTPMVFVMWAPRFEAFVKKFGAVNFHNLAAAARAPGGWSEVAGRPEWGLFKFGHTHPGKSNSGLLTLVLTAYEFAHKQRGLTVADVTSADFRAWLTDFERVVTRHGGSLTHSTGTLMKEMVLRGPSQYDALILYENLAIDFMDQARGLWGELRVAYPEPNLWNEHPYYVLDVPWSGPAERAAAERFLAFLLSEPVQRRALEHGFRPGNPSVAARSADSPLVKFERFGVKLEVPSMAEPPRAEVVTNLLSAFERIAP